MQVPLMAVSLWIADQELKSTTCAFCTFCTFCAFCALCRCLSWPSPCGSRTRSSKAQHVPFALLYFLHFLCSVQVPLMAVSLCGSRTRSSKAQHVPFALFALFALFVLCAGASDGRLLVDRGPGAQKHNMCLLHFLHFLHLLCSVQVL